LEQNLKQHLKHRTTFETSSNIWHIKQHLKHQTTFESTFTKQSQTKQNQTQKVTKSSMYNHATSDNDYLFLIGKVEVKVKTFGKSRSRSGLNPAFFLANWFQSSRILVRRKGRYLARSSAASNKSLAVKSLETSKAPSPFKIRLKFWKSWENCRELFPEELLPDHRPSWLY